MITPVDNILCGPLNPKKVNINNTLLKNIGYSSEILPDGFISRNVNVSANENENNKPTFTYLINDCRENETYEGDKYKELILNKQEPGEENEETIEKLILGMENRIKSIDKKILETYKNTILLDNSLPESYRSNKMLSNDDQEILKRLNNFLEQFASNKFTKNNL